MNVNITIPVDVINVASTLVAHIAVSTTWTVVVALNWMKQGTNVLVSML